MSESTSASGSREVQLAAPGKLNLYLEVLGKRADGFHDLETIFQTIELHDDVRVAVDLKGEGIELVCDDATLPTDSRNLAWRAADLYRRSGGEVGGKVHIALTKRLPHGAGLGGGSSDAGTVLRGLAALANNAVPRHELLQLAARLGSDVPFFLVGGVAEAWGRGEILSPLAIELPWTVLLVNPGIHVSTPWAYRELQVTGSREPSDFASALRLGISDPAILRERIVNDFERPVFEHYPLLRSIKQELYAAGALLALMSGSGSTMLALFADEPTARRSAARFGEHWTAVTRIEAAGALDRI